MKEFGSMKTKREEEYEKWKDHLIDKEGDYICAIPACKKVWFPTTNDVNRKRPSCYYKLCSACRMKSFLKGREYKQKKETNNYDALYDPNNQRGEERVRHERFELEQMVGQMVVASSVVGDTSSHH